jgi:dTDP-4-dehydrorhamnose 3,5-epimerase
VRFTPAAELPDVILIEPRVHADDRGFFLESYHREKFAEAGLPAEFVQDNHSRSLHGVLRGLHFQAPRGQGKLVRVVRGEIYDVAVDIRVGSPTFGHWVGVQLSAENRHQLYIPPDFAHGFAVTSAEADVVYKCTEIYHPGDEGILAWNDPTLAIPWPITEPRLSEKDAHGTTLRDLERAGRLPHYHHPSGVLTGDAAAPPDAAPMAADQMAHQPCDGR